MIASDGIGHLQYFSGGAIYWSPQTGAHEVHGSILKKYQQLISEILDRRNPLSSERAIMGYPTSDVIPSNTCPCHSNFEHGAIYAQLGINTQFRMYAIYGHIFDKWINVQYIVGYPSGDVISLDGRGVFSSFEHGKIYWSPRTAAHEVHGSILDKYIELGSERSWLGYPFSDEIGAALNVRGCPCHSNFEHGVIYTNAGTGWIPQVESYESCGRACPGEG